MDLFKQIGMTIIYDLIKLCFIAVTGVSDGPRTHC
jgi:hypothetical protein